VACSDLSNNKAKENKEKEGYVIKGCSGQKKSISGSKHDEKSDTKSNSSN